MKIFDIVKDVLLNNLTTLHRPYFIEAYYDLYTQPLHFDDFTPAAEALIELDVWACIAIVQDYDKSNYGEIRSDLSNSRKVANLTVSILGEALFRHLYGDTVYFREQSRLSPKELEEMLAIAQRWFEENPEGLSDIFDSILIEKSHKSFYAERREKVLGRVY